MPAKKVNVNILGKGHCEVNAIEKLHVEIKGDAVYSLKENQYYTNESLEKEMFISPISRIN